MDECCRKSLAMLPEFMGGWMGTSMCSFLRRNFQPLGNFGKEADDIILEQDNDPNIL
jgi:hypothetical protein